MFVKLWRKGRDKTFHKAVVADNLEELKEKGSKERTLPHPDHTELPCLSPALKIDLMNNRLLHFNQVVNETAIFYHSKYPELKSSEYYQSIGRRMIRLYPVLAHEGSRPWSFFVGKVGQKVRHLRLKENSKSLVGVNEQVLLEGDVAITSPKPKKFRMDDTWRSRDISDEDYQKYCMLRSCKLTGRRSSIIKPISLLFFVRPDEGGGSGQQAFQQEPCAPLAKMFPCFKEGSFVLEEFINLLSSNPEEMRETIKLNMEKFLCAVKATTNFQADVEDYGSR